MFSDYIRLKQAVSNGRLRAEWDAVFHASICRPWDGRGSGGHIRASEYWTAKSVFPAPFGHRGLYLWGAWSGTDARVQYVGIAHGFVFSQRMERRYVASERADLRRWTELRIAGDHERALRSLETDFSPRRPMSPAKYLNAGIPLPSPGLYSRLPRAERFAKNGLANTWFYLIPAPPETSKKELAVVERELILASNAQLFQWHRQEATRAAPLLNVVHARSRVNPYVEKRDLATYNDWIDGSWIAAGK